MKDIEITIGVLPRYEPDLLEYALGSAKVVFAKRGKLNPVYFIDAEIDPVSHENGKCTVAMTTVFEGANRDEVIESKEAFAETANALARTLRANAIVFVSEIWMSVFESREAAVGAPVPSENPDRKEAIYVVFEKIGQPVYCCFAPIEEVDGARSVGDWESPGMNYSGRFVHNLIQPAKGTA